MSKKRIVFYSPLFITGGMETAVYHLAKLLHKTGRYDVIMAYRLSESTPAVLERFQAIGDVILLRRYKRANGAVWRRDIDKPVECDVMINCSNWEHDNTLIQAKRVIHWIHGTYIANLPKLNRQHPIVVQSEWQKAQIDVQGFQIEVLPNILDEDEIRTLAGQDWQRVKQGTTHFVTVSRLSAEKGWSRLVDFLQRPGNENSICTIVGEAFSENVDKNIKEILKPVRGQLYFAGMQPNPYPYIQNADYVLVFSDFETYGLVSKEAHILGRPVVFSRYATATDQFIKGFDQWADQFDPTLKPSKEIEYVQTEKESVLKRWEDLFNAD